MNPSRSNARQQQVDADAAYRAEVARRAYVSRLVACYGATRAASIVAGTDEAANADLAAWRALGASR